MPLAPKASLHHHLQMTLMSMPPWDTAARSLLQAGDWSQAMGPGLCLGRGTTHTHPPGKCPQSQSTGDHPVLMLDRGGQRARTVPRQKPTGAHHRPRGGRIEPSLSIAHPRANSRWAGKIWRRWWVNRDCLPGKIFQLLVRKGLSLGVRAGGSSSGAGVGRRGRPLSKLAGLGGYALVVSCKREKRARAGFGALNTPTYVPTFVTEMQPLSCPGILLLLLHRRPALGEQRL